MQQAPITEESIKELVHTFYSKVRTDEHLGPIFSQVIGEDKEHWLSHLQKMCDFWSSIMLSSKRYQGNPFQKHLQLTPFDPQLFDRWLELFEETAQEIFPPDIAIGFITRSQRIAQSLRQGISFWQQGS
ncbi:group III truncated hemoglobin [Candidatus Odyssella thessalonicensis]|uniref:group III truncated hemoglobin n=1 Tax=Candidatus Odyssella thessalonicensis TaxID=84647 RepID=UPI000225B4C7|nr:group III truncated hemoglobin [Candidatus Odyssella thessalonicensis]